jgi:hypothetical protein
LPSHLRVGFPTEPACISHVSHVCHMPHSSYSSISSLILSRFTNHDIRVVYPASCYVHIYSQLPVLEPPQHVFFRSREQATFTNLKQCYLHYKTIVFRNTYSIVHIRENGHYSSEIFLFSIVMVLWFRGLPCVGK